MDMLPEADYDEINELLAQMATHPDGGFEYVCVGLFVSFSPFIC